MASDSKFDAWSAGQSYDHYMGRWSQMIAAKYLDWLKPSSDSDWLEIGCGTGALSKEILANCQPKSLFAIEPSEGFVTHAREIVSDARARFEVGGAEQIPLAADQIDVTTSALVLNFVPDKVAALNEMKRVTRPGGTISFYVWDYPSGGIGFIDEFWKAAAQVDEEAAELDEGKRFPFCTSDELSKLCKKAGFENPQVEALEIDTEFATFDDFLHPFTLGAGPAPGYYVSLDQAHRDRLSNQLRQNVGSDEPVKLVARAWAVKMINN